MEIRDIARELTKLTIASGGQGATVSLKDGKAIKNGYLIGGGIINTKDALAEIKYNQGIMDIISEIEFELATEGDKLEKFEAVGTWVVNGVLYLDAVTVEGSFIKAIVKGIERKQQAIGELKNGSYTEHPVPSTVLA
jgi:hypothetical protein